MSESIVTLRIVHSKDLPAKTAELLAQRAYSFLYSQGIEVAVSAALAELPKEPGKENADAPR